MASDREYVLRVRDDDGVDQYISVTVFNIVRYACGLHAGDQLRLKHDLPLFDAAGNPTDKVRSAGEIWRVLSGAEADPSTLWLQQPDGELHTWSDDESVFDVFEVASSQRTA